MNVYFTRRLLEEWGKADSKITTSFDLGITQRQVAKKKISEVVGKINQRLEGEHVKDNYIYLLKKDEIYKLGLFHDGHFYKLRKIKDFKEPILEIDGVRMHVLTGFDSAKEYADEIIMLLGIRKGSCLELCTGLGYWTSEISKHCENVVTIEKSKAVLALAKLNPYSKGLFSKNVKRIHGDAFEKVSKMDEKFDFIVHDPPRYSHAPQLYTLEFYKMLRSRLNPGGKLFHYTGTFTSHGEFHSNVRKNLELAGFRNVKRIERLQGFTACL